LHFPSYLLDFLIRLEYWSPKQLENIDWSCSLEIQGYLSIKSVENSSAWAFTLGDTRNTHDFRSN
jgi:hypothetical protein